MKQPSHLVGVLDVQLVEGLYVLVDEGDGDQHQVLVSALHQGLDGVLGVGAQPRQGSDLGLPDEAVRVGPAERLHDEVNGGPHLGGVGVAPVHDVLGHGVGGEELAANFDIFFLPSLLKLCRDKLERLAAARFEG